MNKLLKWLCPEIGVSYRFGDDYGGKFGDGSRRDPLKYVPTEFKGGRVFYDVISPNLGLICGDSLDIITFRLYFRRYDRS